MYCKHCKRPLEQRPEKAIGNGEVQMVWATSDDDWVCANNGGDEHEPTDEPQNFTLVVTQEVAYYDRREETLEEILESVENGTWEDKNNEVIRERVKVYLNEPGAEDGTLVYDSGDEE